MPRSTVAWTRIGVIVFGRMWRNMMVRPGTPIARAASTKVRCRDRGLASHEPGVPGPPRHDQRERRVGQTRAERRHDSHREQQRRKREEQIRGSHDQAIDRPPRKPAIAPSGAPISTAKMTTRNGTSRAGFPPRAPD